MAAGGSVPAEAGFAVEIKTDCLHVQVFFLDLKNS